MVLGYAPLVTSTRLASREHSADDAREQGKCDLDAAVFYWGVTRFHVRPVPGDFGLHTYPSRLEWIDERKDRPLGGSMNAKAVLLTVFTTVIGVACIFCHTSPVLLQR